MSAVGIVGAGRAGTGLALALAEAGHRVRLHGRRGKAVPPPLTLSWGGQPPWLHEVDVVILAVRDEAVPGLAEELAATGRIEADHVVLHLSGLLDARALAALEGTGAALGSLHPLQAIARPEAAPQRLRGAVAVLEGDERAVVVGTALAESVGLRPVPLAAHRKAHYHAAAVFASNYLVVLAATAERLAGEAGLAPADARAGLRALMYGTLANLGSEVPAADALTGPVARGDAATVRRHLAALPPDLAELYRSLGRAALRMADLAPETRRAVAEALGD